MLLPQENTERCDIGQADVDCNADAGYSYDIDCNTGFGTGGA